MGVGSDPGPDSKPEPEKQNSRNMSSRRQELNRKHQKRLAKELKKRIDLSTSSFCTPPQNTPFWAPRKSLCASFPGKERERDPHKLFRGNLGVKKGVPNRPFWATKGFSFELSCSICLCCTCASGLFAGETRIAKRFLFTFLAVCGCFELLSSAVHERRQLSLRSLLACFALTRSALNQ